MMRNRPFQQIKTGLSALLAINMLKRIKKIFQELDLCNPATFRDMAKSMGAQTPDRLKHFKKRFHDWDDPQGMTKQ